MTTAHKQLELACQIWNKLSEARKPEDLLPVIEKFTAQIEPLKNYSSSDASIMRKKLLAHRMKEDWFIKSRKK